MALWALPILAETDTVQLPSNTEAAPDRWRIPVGIWQRYDNPASRGTETPYKQAPQLWDPYLQSKLKGDLPIFRQDIFMNVTAFSISEFEARSLPKPSGVSTERPNSSEFYGRGDELFYSNNFGLRVDVFRGETAFKPVEWLVRLEPVMNINYTKVEERNILYPNPQRGTDRFRDFVALQEGFLELHLRDLSPNYDFLSSKWGLQSFNADFRGFVFTDTDLGARVFGNADNNHWQYNLIIFDKREKDTYSGLNSFQSRDQYVLVANVYRQDFFAKGYTAQISFLANQIGRAHV